MRASLLNRVLICVLSCIGASAWANEAEELLARMNQAFSEVSYDGVFSYYSGDELASLRVVHKIVDGVQRERLVHLNGAPREILREGDEVACLVMPGDDLIGLQDSIPTGPFARAFVRQFDRLSGTYEVGVYGSGRVAGRAAVRLGVTPKDKHRYGYRLWVDQETALLLRSELVDEHDNKLEIFQFNYLVTGEGVPDSALDAGSLEGFEVSHLRLAGEPHAVSAANTSLEEWTTGWLPPGFMMATSDVRRKPGHDVTNLVYSDGLAAFSIFIEPMPSRGAASMVSQHGATVAMTHQIGVGEEYHLVTLVGEIPPDTASEIIKSIRRKSS